MSKLLVFIIVFGVLGFLGFRLASEMGLKTYILQLKYPIRYQDIVENYVQNVDILCKGEGVVKNVERKPGRGAKMGGVCS